MSALLHVYRWGQAALDVDPAGPAAGVPYRHGAWTCVLCGGLAGFHARFCHGGCPGPVAPAPRGAQLAGADPVDADGAVRPRPPAWRP